MRRLVVVWPAFEVPTSHFPDWVFPSSFSRRYPASREKLDGRACLSLVGLKTERQLSVTRDEPKLVSRGRGRNLALGRNIRSGSPLMKTDRYDGEK